MPTERADPEGSPLVIEIVGPPGTGKSTLLASLVEGRAHVVGNPRIRELTTRPVIARVALASLATLVRRRALMGRWGREQVRTMTNISLWPRLVPGPDAAARLYAFDQGPIFFLTRPILMTGRLTRWWTVAVTSCAAMLDAVVELDAPDSVLLERIEGREKAHRLKGVPLDDAVENLAGVRRVYADFVAELGRRPHGPRVLRFDTSTQTPDEIARDVLARLSV